MIEQKLYRTVLFNRLRIRVGKLTENQIFITYHINGLVNGDERMRDDFPILQKWYSRVLNLSTEQVREYMDHVDVNELQGFSEQLITRSFELEDYDDDNNDDNNDSDNNAEPHIPSNPESSTDEAPSQTDFIDLGPIDEEILRSVELASAQALQVYLNANVPSYSPANHTVPPGTQITQGAQEGSADAAYYDKDGFYIGGYEEDVEMTDGKDEKTTDRNDGEPAAQSKFSSSPLADEAEGTTDEWLHRPTDASPDTLSSTTQEQFILPTNSTPSELSSSADWDQCGTEPSSPVPWNPPEYDVSPTSDLDLSTSSLDPYEPPPDTPGSNSEDEPLSEALQSLLVELNGDPKTTRTHKNLFLTDLEVSVAGNMWEKRVAEFKRKEAKRGLDRHAESWEETDWLDGFDIEHCQFNWQTEGLFLCRLAELLYKTAFVQARTTFWSERRNPVSWTGRGKEKLPGSPLRNVFTLR